MADQASLDATLAAALGNLAESIGTPPPEPTVTGAFRLRDGDIALVVHGVPHTNEIEWLMECLDWEDKVIPSDCIQSWMGEPVTAYQFNETNAAVVAGMVADILRRVLLAFRDDRQAALAGLREAESSMLEFNRLADRRAEASKAWSRGDYAKVREIYSAMTGVLTPLEVKRLSIARRK